MHNGSSPYHLSIQNFTLLPLPTTKKKKKKKRKPKKVFCSFLKDFQSPTPYPTKTSPNHHPPSPYLSLITRVQKATLPMAYLQLHLHKSTLLNKDKRPIPNPPLLFSKHTVDYFTRCIFFFIVIPTFRNVDHSQFFFLGFIGG